MESMSILKEAEQIINGARAEAYGDILECTTRVAGLVNAAFAHKLSEKFEPEDTIILMLLLKIAREVNQHQRDNLTDIAGYAGCLEKLKKAQASASQGKPGQSACWGRPGGYLQVNQDALEDITKNVNKNPVQV